MRLQSTMRNLFLLLAVVSFGHTSVAADAVDGTWKWSSNVGEGTINSVLQLDVKGTKLTGRYRNEMHDVSISKASISGNEIQFEIAVEMEGSDITVKFDGTFTDATIDGDIEIYVDGQHEMELEWDAIRSTEPKDVVGTWNFVYTAPDGVEYTPALKVSLENGKLAGKISNDGDSLPVKSLKLNNHQLSFEYTIDYQGSDLNLVYDCKPRGNKLTGLLTYDVDGNTGDFEIVATRSQVNPRLAAIAGTWKCAATAPDGTEHTPELVITLDGKKAKGTVKGANIDVSFDDIKVENDEVLFGFTNEHDGVAVKLNWRVKTSGDKLNGIIEFDVDGNTGEIKVEGERQ